MNDYLTVEEAADFLNISKSTLYRWVREDRISAHKMGRQWRFVRAELEAALQGADTSQHLRELAVMLNQRSSDGLVGSQPKDLCRQLIWDAFDHQALVVHLSPRGDSHDIRLRGEEGLSTLTTVSSESFQALNQEWIRMSQPVRGEQKRRLFLERQNEKKNDRLQVRYQEIHTLAGPRLVLRLMPENRFALDVDVIAPQKSDSKILRMWMKARQGIILVSGRPGSGKTTTAYVCLHELAAKGDKVIFTLEDTIGTYIAGVHQVEVDLDDERAFREACSAIMDSDVDVLFISSSIASKHQRSMWQTAMSAAESGHLVFVQLEADSAEDAIERFKHEVDGPLDTLLVGSVWQELLKKKGGGRKARYAFANSE